MTKAGPIRVSLRISGGIRETLYRVFPTGLESGMIGCWSSCTQFAMKTGDLSENVASAKRQMTDRTAVMTPASKL